MTFSPLACSALALASTANVADSAMEASRADARRGVTEPMEEDELIADMLAQ